MNLYWWGPDANTNGETVDHDATSRTATESGPGGGVMVYAPIGAVDVSSCNANAYSNVAGNGTLTAQTSCSGTDQKNAFQKDLGSIPPGESRRPRHAKDLLAHRCVVNLMPNGRDLSLRARARRHGTRARGHRAGHDERSAHCRARRARRMSPRLRLRSSGRAAPRVGRLEAVLHAWCPSFPGFCVYSPSRRQQSPALRALVAAMQKR